MVRIPIKRVPITLLREKGYNYGGWMHFPKDESKKPLPPYHLKPNTRLLWCCYCNAWEIFEGVNADTMNQSTRWNCTGWCGWNSTDDYYTKRYNNLWGSAVVSKKRKKGK